MKWLLILLLPLTCFAQTVKINQYDPFVKKHRVEMEPVLVTSTPSTKLSVAFSSVASDVFVQLSGWGWGAATVDDGNDLIFLFSNDSTVTAKSSGLQTFETGSMKGLYKHQYKIAFDDLQALSQYELVGIRKYSFKEFTDLHLQKDAGGKLKKPAALFLAELKKADVIKTLKPIDVKDIARHVNDSVQFCSRVYNTRYYEASKNKPTVLDVQSDFNDPVVNVVILEDDRKNFGNTPEKTYLNQEACISGVVTLRNNVPTIVVRKRDQLRIKAPATLDNIALFIGDSITVSGNVLSARYLTETATSPTLLNLGAPFPNQLLTVVIEQQDRSRFGADPELYYLNKEIAVTGRVVMYKGKPQIVVQSKSQINVIAENTAATTASYKPPVKTETPVPLTTEVEEPAIFQGGSEAWSKFLRTNLIVPMGLDNDEKKTVIASFYVDVDGTTRDFKITQSAGKAFDNEVLRVLKLMPRWKPRHKGNFYMGVTVSLPVTFKAGDKDEPQAMNNQ